jgi:hypothetical protein
MFTPCFSTAAGLRNCLHHSGSASECILCCPSFLKQADWYNFDQAGSQLDTPTFLLPATHEEYSTDIRFLPFLRRFDSLDSVEMTTPSRGRVFFALLLSLLIQTISASRCGSLVTYRQYSTLLDSAPSCLRNGCGGNDTANSMSSSCPSTAPCSQIWDLMQSQYQQDWCNDCKHDIACRIPEWPVMNATAVCDVSPHTWLFDASGTCCNSGNDPFELANWVGSLCNGSDWRSSFSEYGWMAQQDWAEYLLPWNDTVAPQGVDSHNRQLIPECSKTPWYLGVFFLENVFYLTCAILFGLSRLWWIKLKENNEAPVQRLCWWKKKPSQEAIHPGPVTRSFLGPYLPILVGIILAGLQVGLAMASAKIIRNHEGYGHTNVGHLGLLFCSRPRLTWFACVLGLFRRSLPKKFFKSRHGRTAARAVLAGVAVSSTVSEGILQIVGIYYMVITANSGRHKGFYAPHHLSPYWNGSAALRMYIGALMWLIACAPIIFIWPIIAMFHARIFFLLRKARIGLLSLFNFHPQQPIHSTSNQSDHGFNEERVLLFVPESHLHNQYNDSFDDYNEAGALHRPTEKQEPGHGMPRRDYYGSPSNLRPTEMQEPGSASIRGGGYSGSIHPEMMQEAGDYAEAPSPHTSQRPSRGGIRGGDGSAQVRRRNGYQGLRQTSAGSEPYHNQYGSRGTPWGIRGGGVADDGLPPPTRWNYEEWQAPIIWLGVTIGLISYVAQWLFWDGFIKASGSRYGTPDFGKSQNTKAR